MLHSQKRILIGLHTIILSLLLQNPSLVTAGEYLNSAHGSGSYGVLRSDMTDYAVGNCGHCHEAHSSLLGTEPPPFDGNPSPYTLFTRNFNTSASTGPFIETDTFCFFCHSSLASVQPVINHDYSTTFGGATLGSGPQYIMEAFNQTSYHNLSDIHNFLDGNGLFPWYTNYSNPCNSCHNPHLAKRNYNNFIAPLSSAIARPSNHFSPWGESELMSIYGAAYTPPYANATSQTREPDGANTADGSKIPDYVSLCLDCHTSTNTIISTTLGRTILDIDWSSSGDKHGVVTMDVGVYLKPPFASTGNYVLSCLDCHEPHGSPSVTLIRRRVNGSDLPASITPFATPNWGYICQKCHYDDQDAYNADLPDARRRLQPAQYTEPYHWRYIHHYEPLDRPYGGSSLPKCSTCHDPGPPGPIDCINCHEHGVLLNILYGNSAGTSRKTF